MKYQHWLCRVITVCDYMLSPAWYDTMRPTSPASLPYHLPNDCQSYYYCQSFSQPHTMSFSLSVCLSSSQLYIVDLSACQDYQCIASPYPGLHLANPTPHKHTIAYTSISGVCLQLVHFHSVTLSRGKSEREQEREREREREWERGWSEGRGRVCGQCFCPGEK